MDKMFHKLKKYWTAKGPLAGKVFLLFVMAVLIQTPLFAQAEQAGQAAEGISTTVLLQVVLAAVIVVSALVLMVAAYIVYILKIILLNNKEQAAASEVTEAVKEEEEPKRSILDRLNGSVALEEEESILLDHDYDGIRELDNHLPPWWTYSFYASIVFAFVYFCIYHVFDVAPLQDEEYKMEIAEAKAAMDARVASVANVIDESNVELSTEASELENGKKIYMRSCAACHGQEGQGGIGPNLTDVYWLHGGSVSDVFKTIKYGVPGKGMVAWESKLSPTSIRDVTSYLISLEGSEPANAKAPQGEKYERN